jgi:hypothetical protein
MGLGGRGQAGPSRAMGADAPGLGSSSTPTGGSARAGRRAGGDAPAAGGGGGGGIFDSKPKVGGFDFSSDLDMPGMGSPQSRECGSCVDEEGGWEDAGGMPVESSLRSYSSPHLPHTHTHLLLCSEASTKPLAPEPSPSPLGAGARSAGRNAPAPASRAPPPPSAPVDDDSFGDDPFLPDESGSKPLAFDDALLPDDSGSKAAPSKPALGSIYSATSTATSRAISPDRGDSHKGEPREIGRGMGSALDQGRMARRAVSKVLCSDEGRFL